MNIFEVNEYWQVIAKLAWEKQRHPKMIIQQSKLRISPEIVEKASTLYEWFLLLEPGSIEYKHRNLIIWKDQNALYYKMKWG